MDPINLSLEFLGFDAEEITTEDQLKEQFNKDFIKRSNIEQDEDISRKLSGKILGTLDTASRQFAKELGIEIKHDDFNSLKPNEKFKHVSSQALAAKDVEIEALKASQGNSNDEQLKEAQEKNIALKALHAEEKEHLRNTVDDITGKFDLYKEEITVANFNKSKGDQWGSALSRVEFKSDINPYEKTGFLSESKDKYDWKQDEESNWHPVTKDGKRIANPDKAGDFYGADNFHEVLNKDAQDGNLLKINPKDGEGTTKKEVFKKQDNKQVVQPTGMRVNYAARNVALGKD